MKGNKGEWSEIYALFKILSDKVLYVGDENLEKIADIYYPIVNVLRMENKNCYRYDINQDIVIISSNNNEVARIAVAEFKENSIILFDKIKKAKGTFYVPELSDFISKIQIDSLKADSNVKTDITIKVHDQYSGQEPILGFSIKSMIGSAATLLNAGKTTNFKYQINGPLTTDTANEINAINSRSKVLERLNSLEKLMCDVEFQQVESDVFSNNLILIDSLLPKLLSFIVKKFYQSKYSKLSELVKEVEIDNPLSFDLTQQHQYYQYKIKRFLTDIALGMMPSKVWNGVYEATGGYLVIKEDGDVICYHIYNKNEFESYLYNNTKLETASTSRHGFGVIYEKNDQFFINLNLQIRFIK